VFSYPRHPSFHIKHSSPLGRLILFDVCDLNSYNNALRHLIHGVSHEVLRDHELYIMVGCQFSGGGNRAVAFEQVLDAAHTLGVSYYETNIDNGLNLGGCIEKIA
jgi:hypothetical protein